MLRKLFRQLDRIFDIQLLLSSMFALLALLIGVRAFAQTPLVKIDGSSTVFPILEAFAEEFQISQKNKVKVTVGISGTGGGFKKFCRGETDVQNASRPIQASELADCKKAGIKFIELPIAFDAIVVVANPKSTWLSEITIEELKKLWEPGAQGKITAWNMVNPKWPAAPVKLYGPGADSGTFDYFTEAIVGKAKSSRGDFTASEDDNTIVQGVSSDVNGLGYFGLAYYESNKSKLKAVKINGGEKSPTKGKAIMPNRETVTSGTYFPLSRPVFIYVNEASLKRTEVRAFTEFALKNANQLVAEVKYIPLPEQAYKLGLEHVQKGKTGTVFDGHSEVGMKIEDLMKREAKM